MYRHGDVAIRPLVEAFRLEESLALLLETRSLDLSYEQVYCSRSSRIGAAAVDNAVVVVVGGGGGSGGGGGGGGGAAVVVVAVVGVVAVLILE